MQQFKEEVEKDELSLPMPYKIPVEKGLTEDAGAGGGFYSIRTHLNTEEQWTIAFKLTLISFKWSLTWISLKYYQNIFFFSMRRGVFFALKYFICETHQINCKTEEYNIFIMLIINGYTDINVRVMNVLPRANQKSLLSSPAHLCPPFLIPSSSLLPHLNKFKMTAKIKPQDEKREGSEKKGGGL